MLRSTVSVSRLRPRVICRFVRHGGASSGILDAGVGGRTLPQAPLSATQPAPGLKIVDTPPDGRVLHVTLMGSPNAGKSVLVNRLVDATVSAVSKLYHTTRSRMTGVMTSTEDAAQVCFYDTPGIVAPSDKRYRSGLVSPALESVKVSDVTVLVVDAAARLTPERKELLQGMVQAAVGGFTDLWVVLNKVDLVNARWRKVKEEEYASAVREVAPHVSRVYFLSALHTTGVDQLRRDLYEAAAPGSWVFNEAFKTDLPTLAHVEEIIRESIYKFTHKEVPYSVVQRNRGWQEMPDGTIRCWQNLETYTQQHFRILKGQCAQRIQDRAEARAGEALGRKVELSLTVVQKKKKKKPAGGTKQAPRKKVRVRVPGSVDKAEAPQPSIEEGGSRAPGAEHHVSAAPRSSPRELE